MSKTVQTASYIGQFGCCVAAGLSLAKFGGFWLTVGHFFAGWIYVFYYLAKYGIPGVGR